MRSQATTIRATVLLLLSVSAWGADFQNGEAARAVVGQPSFSARGPGIAASNLAVSNGRLYVTDTAHRLLVFDLKKIPRPNDEPKPVETGACAVCGFAPDVIANQSIVQSSPALSIYGKIVVFADTSNHRVLIWRDTTKAGPSQPPDVVLGQTTSNPSSESASMLIAPASVTFDGKRLFVGDIALKRVLIWNSLPVVNDQPANVVLGQPDFALINGSNVPGADTIGEPMALASDGTNLFVADSLNRRILIFSAADAPLRNHAVVNSATLAAGPLAPGTLITITGNNLSELSASGPEDGVQRLPTRLGGVEVFFDGIPLPLLAVSPTQVRAQLPYDLRNVSSASLYVRTEHSDGSVATTNAVGVEIVPASPGLFGFAGAEPRSGLILHAAANVSGQSGIPVTSENPATAGEELIVWATGLGTVRESGATAYPIAGMPYAGLDAQVTSPVGALVNGRSTQVVSAKLPQGSIGIYEVHIILPPDLANDPKAQLLIVQAGNVSNTVTLPVRTAER